MKHLHHKALEYDIGVYFEANGHGTVIFQKTAKERLKQAANDSSLTDIQRNAAKRLLNLIDVINETVGDAISDMLLVETILHAKGWDVEDWEATYTDLPNKLVKVTIEVSLPYIPLALDQSQTCQMETLIRNCIQTRYTSLSYDKSESH